MRPLGLRDDDHARCYPVALAGLRAVAWRPSRRSSGPLRAQVRALDIYHAWCDLKPGVSDTAFCEGVARYMGHLKGEGLIEGWRLTRRKLGFGAPGLGEFHLMIEVRNLGQLEEAFQRVAGRREPVEGF